MSNRPKSKAEVKSPGHPRAQNDASPGGEQESRVSPEIARRIEAMLAPVLADMGYGIVRVMLLGGARRLTLQLMAERLDGRGMNVSDCAAISRTSAAILDVEDPVKGAYDLEVSSPGIDRPLVKREDFIRFAGFVAKLETERLVSGRKRFKGVIGGIDDADHVRLEEESGEVFLVPFTAVTKAKLIITDALLAKSPDRPRAEQTADERVETASSE